MSERTSAGGAPRKCATCGGTGWQWLMNSWFTSDGYRRAKCSICDGSGVSDYHPDPDFARRQTERRKAMEFANAR